MKKITTLTMLLMALLVTNHVSAKIWRVNNTTGVVADFTTPQAAHDAASAGDTIHIEPSTSSYGSLDISKPLVIVGNGYYLDQDTLLQANINNSGVTYLYFEVAASGSTVQGLNVSYIYVYASNVTIKRNYLYFVYVYANANNCNIIQNFITNSLNEGGGPITGLNISNNIFGYATGVAFSSDATGSFTNNDLYYSSVNVYNFQLNNNIFFGASFTLNNNVYFNNIGDGTQFGTANGNQQNVVMTAVFQEVGSPDFYWQLAAGSPAINAGYGGSVDCGAYGGPNPYKLGLIPNVPAIYKLSVPPVGTNSINVTISTRSNN